MLVDSACATRVLAVLVVFACSGAEPATSDEPGVDENAQAITESEPVPEFQTELIRGKVLWTAAALQDQFGISTVPEAAENSLALLTAEGGLLPIVENVRGRAFRKDPRLRGKEMELLVRRYQQQPLVQVLRIYLLEDSKRYELDYWCDVCAIVMFETGPCSCCQDDNRLRKRLAEKEDSALP